MLRRPFCLFALGAPLLFGIALPDALAMPPASLIERPAMPNDVVKVDFLSRLLNDGGHRRASSSHRRAPRASRNAEKSRQPAAQGIPALPALASIPIPLARPDTAQAQAQSMEPAPETKPVAGPPAPEKQQAQKPVAGPPAPAAKADDSAKDVAPPLVEQPATASEPAHQAEVPKPLVKPTEPQTGETGTPPDPAKPADGEAQQAEKPASPPPPPLVHEDPAELKACLAELTAIGAKFAPTDPIDEGEGCGIEHPVDVDEVLPGLSLGGATMRCQTALTMAHWLKDTVQPVLKVAKPGRSIVRITPGSTYACRLRNNAATGKISEHARGNAFDVAGFTFDNGDVLEMKPRSDDHTLEGALQKTVTAGACLHFTTVLAPGSDASHETHLHLDIMERKGGYRICESP